MRIHCQNWLEGLHYFTCPDTIRRMRELGLYVERMDAKTKNVYLAAREDVDMEEYLDQLANIASSSAPEYIGQ